MGRLVEESDLDFSRFRCCGDEDLYPFACPRCGRVMVFCYECDTLYRNLDDTGDQYTEINHRDPREPVFACPQCGYPFDYFFIGDGRYRVAHERWVAAGFGHLLVDRVDS
jgi:predicted RNA-binding Zn-ribbon protein involved in translation (DUF1610 family)